MVPAEVLLVAVVAARYFNNNLERALIILRQRQYIPASRCLSLSRFNRQLHQQANFLDFCLHTLMELAMSGEALLSTACPCRYVGVLALVAVGRCVGASTAAIVPPSEKSSSAGDFT